MGRCLNAGMRVRKPRSFQAWGRYFDEIKLWFLEGLVHAQKSEAGSQHLMAGIVPSNDFDYVSSSLVSSTWIFTMRAKTGRISLLPILPILAWGRKGPSGCWE